MNNAIELLESIEKDMEYIRLLLTEGHKYILPLNTFNRVVFKLDKLKDMIDKGGITMYDKLLKGLEENLWGNYDVEVLDYKKLSELADLIIKIKTIQALDTSADLIRASREVGKN